MDLDMVLNELSLRTPANSVQTAKQWMLDLTETAQIATEHGVNDVLRVHSEFYTTELVSGYSVSDWLYDSSVDLEVRLLLNALITKSPLLDDLEDTEIEDRKLLSDFLYEGTPANGLGVAFLLEFLALSVRSEPRWEFSSLVVEATWLEDDNNLNSEIVTVFHASRLEHIQRHIPWIQNRLRRGVRDGLDLWNRKSDLFPSLSFCETVGKQLRSIYAGQLELQLVVKALFELENYCKNWKTGSFSLEGYAIEASRESEATINKYWKERTFCCPDGEERLFDWHIKLRLCNWRIHLFPEVAPGKTIIGYVGRHLPTVKNPT